MGMGRSSLLTALGGAGSYAHPYCRRMDTWDPNAPASTPDPTPDIVAVLIDPGTWRTYNVLASLGPMRARPLGALAKLSESSALGHLRRLRSIGFATHSVAESQDRYREWKVVPGGLRLNAMVRGGRHDELINRWIAVFLECQQLVMREWTSSRNEWPLEWRDASTTYDWLLKLTIDELGELSDELFELGDRWNKRSKEASVVDLKDDRDERRAVYLSGNAVFYPMKYL